MKRSLRRLPFLTCFAGVAHPAAAGAVERRAVQAPLQTQRLTF